LALVACTRRDIRPLFVQFDFVRGEVAEPG
jgi:hypothetical protein